MTTHYLASLLSQALSSETAEEKEENLWIDDSSAEAALSDRRVMSSIISWRQSLRYLNGLVPTREIF